MSKYTLKDHPTNPELVQLFLLDYDSAGHAAERHVATLPKEVVSDYLVSKA